MDDLLLCLLKLLSESGRPGDPEAEVNGGMRGGNGGMRGLPAPARGPMPLRCDSGEVKYSLLNASSPARPNGGGSLEAATAAAAAAAAAREDAVDEGTGSLLLSAGSPLLSPELLSLALKRPAAAATSLC